MGAICVAVPRTRAGKGAGKGITVMAATAANESTLPRERGLESSSIFILEKQSTSPSMSNVGRRTAVVIGRRSHVGAPKFVKPFFDGKGSYVHEVGYLDGNACKGARGSSGLHRLSVTDITSSLCLAGGCEELGGDAGAFFSSSKINFSIRWYRLSKGRVAPSATAFLLKT